MRVSSAEASDGGEDLVCGLGAAERLRIGILGIDVCLDCGFQGFGRAVGPALDLRFAEDCEDALELIDSGRGRSREVWVPARPFGDPVADRFGLVARRVVQNEANVGVSGHIRSTVSRNRRNSCARCRDKASGDNGSGLHVQRGKQRCYPSRL
jgi:hypothetical protein